MNLTEYLTKKALAISGGISKTDDLDDEDEKTFVNSKEEIQRLKLREYVAWYKGDGDELLNLYTKDNTIDFNYEPWYWRNKLSYFWAVSSTEADLKRTHSGMPRNIVDTLVAIVGTPMTSIGLEGNKYDKSKPILDEMLGEGGFWRIYQQEQMPMTLVEGWGAYKINWNSRAYEHPYAEYYRANDIRLIQVGKKTIGIIFLNWYSTEKCRRILVAESRWNAKDKDGDMCLYVSVEAFKCEGESGTLSKIDLKEVPQMAGVEKAIKIKGYNKLLAEACVLYDDPTCECPGRSIFTGKLDVFDDMDQCLSQAANTIRRSTPQEVFDTNFLQRDPKTKLPVQPHCFDRKYIAVDGPRDVNGSPINSTPVQVTQPQVRTDMYDMEFTSLLIQAVSGIMSPATLGIDIAKKDNADAQREKEKVTIFTRNEVIEREKAILKSLFSQMMCADELMRTGEITCRSYDVSVKYNEFADESFESKLDALGKALDMSNITPEMYVSKLYGSSLSDAEKDRELEFLREAHPANPMPPDDGMGAAPMGQTENPLADMMGGPDAAEGGQGF